MHRVALGDDLGNGGLEVGVVGDEDTQIAAGVVEVVDEFDADFYIGQFFLGKSHADLHRPVQFCLDRAER